MIDAHLHLWDPVRWSYPWLDDLPPLRRRFDPGDLHAGAHSPDAVVFVEAGRHDDDPVTEVTWVEDLATGWPSLVGIVAHAALERGPDVAPLLHQLAARPLVKGIRRNLQDESSGFTTSDLFQAGVRRLARHGLVFDLCVRSWQLPEVTELARTAPDVMFVLDHIGKPELRHDQWQPWADELERLAHLDNVVVKLSGLTSEASRAWTPSKVLPYLEHALSVFGADRCMFGSDWPVSTLSIDYPGWVDLVSAALANASPAERALVLHDVAARTYRLDAGKQ